ncbi:MAG: SgcJ/EcaC family oxidoreductase [Acidobacteriota bacterium]|nr:MAG: SgcJ/EcaC family oxidoreductase [Acidobacteriota bacterium]
MLLVLVALLLVGGCQTAEKPIEDPQMAAKDERSEEIRAVVREILAAMNRGDSANVAKNLSEDVVFLPPNAERISGKDAVTASITSFLEANRVNMSFTTDEIQTSGEWAYDIGRFTRTVQPKSGGETRVEFGKAVLVFRMDGPDWRLHSYLWNFSQ